MKNQRQQQFIYLMDKQWQEIIPEHHPAQVEVFIRIDFFPMQMKTRNGKGVHSPTSSPASRNLEGLASDLVTSENPSPVQMEWSESEFNAVFYGSVTDGASSPRR